MPWECGECGAVEGKDKVTVEGKEVVVTVDVICHHCGKPLCQKHRIQIVDDAFSSDDKPVSREAYHCDECKKAYHPRAVLVRAQAIV